MVGDTILIKDISINGNDELKNASDLSKELTDKTINALGIDASSRTIWINGQPYGNAYVNVNGNNTIEKPIGGEIFNDFTNNVASGDYSHAEGNSSIASGVSSHTEGKGTVANNEAEHAEGKYNKSNNNTIHSVGIGTSEDDRKNAIEVMKDGSVYINGIGKYTGTNPSGSKDLATILSTVDTSDTNSFIVENDLKVNRNTTIGGTLGVTGDTNIGGNTTIGGTLVTGTGTSASGSHTHAEGLDTTAVGNYSHTEGEDTTASGKGSHAEGYNTETGGIYDSNPKTVWNGNQSGYFAHAEGNSTIAQGACSHAEGTLTFAQGQSSHAEGYETTASEAYSHAEGTDTTASGLYSHAEGCATTAQGRGSHAEGIETTANGDYSHTGGHITTANGKYSHVTGSYNTAEGSNSTLQGYYLFDHGIDTENSFIWLMGVSIDNVIIGAGFIRIIQPFIVDPENTVKDPREDHYEVRGSLWVGDNKPKIQEVMTYDDTKYYISKSTLDNIISSWNTNTPEQLTSQFRIFEYSEETNKLSPIGGALRGAALFGDGAEKWNGSGSLGKTLYESYITSIKALSTAGAIAIKDAYEEERPNNKPVEFVNNNATIVGQYNKPQPTDIFEVGCGGYDSALEIIRQNAISVKSNGETTIPDLKTDNASVTNLTSNSANVTNLTSNSANVTNLTSNITKSGILNSDLISVGSYAEPSGKWIHETLAKLPEAPVQDACQSFICKDGILIGYSQTAYMYLTIDDQGKIYLGRYYKDVGSPLGGGEYRTELTASSALQWVPMTKG